MERFNNWQDCLQNTAIECPDFNAGVRYDGSSYEAQVVVGSGHPLTSDYLKKRAYYTLRYCLEHDDVDDLNKWRFLQVDKDGERVKILHLEWNSDLDRYFSLTDVKEKREDLRCPVDAQPNRPLHCFLQQKDGSFTCQKCGEEVRDLKMWCFQRFCHIERVLSESWNYELRKWREQENCTGDGCRVCASELTKNALNRFFKDNGFDPNSDEQEQLFEELESIILS